MTTLDDVPVSWLDGHEKWSEPPEPTKEQLAEWQWLDRMAPQTPPADFENDRWRPGPLTQDHLVEALAVGLAGPALCDLLLRLPAPLEDGPEIQPQRENEDQVGHSHRGACPSAPDPRPVAASWSDTEGSGEEVGFTSASGSVASATASPHAPDPVSPSTSQPASPSTSASATASTHPSDPDSPATCQSASPFRSASTSGAASAGAPVRASGSSSPSRSAASSALRGTSELGRVRGPGADRIERMQGWARVVAHAQAKLLGEVSGLWDMREADPTYTGSDLAAYCEFVAVEVGLALRLGPRAAQSLVDDAVTLTHHLPSTVQALEAGRIDLATARAIADETALLSEEATARVEAAALVKAETGTARAVRMFTRRQAITEDPTLMAQRAEAAAEEVGVTKTDIVDGVGDLVVTLSATDLCAVWTALTDQARALKAIPGETRALTRLRALALVDMVTRPWLYVPAAEQLRQSQEARGGGYVPSTTASDAGTSGARSSTDAATRSSGVDGQSGTAPGASGLTGPVVVDPSRSRAGKEPPARSGRWKVDVIVNLTTLLGLDDVAALLVGTGPVSADVAREFAADGMWRRLVTDPVTGVVLERSTTRYRPTAALGDHVEARDQHCQTPGCRRVAYECEKDHRKPYEQGGLTCPCNTWALCKYHHRCKHSPGWRFHRELDGSTTVTGPTGHTYTAPPSTPWD